MKEKVKASLKSVFDIIKKPEMKVLPGQLAFFFVLSMVPIITLIGYSATFFGLSMKRIVAFLSTSFSSEIASLLVPIIDGKSFDSHLFFFICISYFIASNGSHSIIISSNAIYGIENSTWLKRRIKSLFMTFFLVLLFIFILVVPVFGSKILGLIDAINPNLDSINLLKRIYPYINPPITLFIIFISIKIIYTMAPDQKTHSVTVNKGSIFTTIFWFIITEIYTFYIHNLAHYDLFYGGLSNIVILMLWIYFMAYIFVIGMALNHKEEVNMLEKTGNIKIKD